MFFKKCYEVLLFVTFFIQLTIASVYANSQSAYDLGEVVVTASRFEEYVKQSGNSISVITKKEMDEKKYKTVLQALKREVGVSTSSNGAFGGSASIFLRGSDSGHTLVMLDGVRLYDPISTNATYDLSNLTLDNVERIEIIKGPQSSLYGSDAMGGVINIITKKGQGKPSLFVSVEAASKNTFTERFGASGSKGRFHYSIGASRQDSEGISKVRDGDEEDSYERTQFNTKISYDVSENVEIGAQSLYLKAKYDIDDGAFQDDPNYWLKYENFVNAIFAKQRVNDVWDQSLRYSWLRNVRKLRDDADDVDTSEFFRAVFKGWLQEVDWQHNLNIGEAFTFGDYVEDMMTIGFQYEHETGHSRSTFGGDPSSASRRHGYYLQNKVSLSDKLFNTMAIRTDHHSRFGSFTTGRATLSYLFDTQTRLKGSYGTGFNAPSLYQLFSDFGDPNLSPEESWGYDVGLEQELFDQKVFVSSTFFLNRYKNLIEFDSTVPNPKLAFFPFGKYVNTGSAVTRGIETELRYAPTDQLKFGYTFTYTHARDLENKLHLVRRPNNKHNLNVNYSPIEKVNLNLDIIRNVKIFDTVVFGSPPERLKDYTVFDFATTYDVTDNFEVYLKVENMFDETYMESYGFSNKPRFVHLGIKAQF